eukprot:m51a1_g14466 putative alkyl hydroperoxide reductase (156) ;mRNA; f:668435-669172
MSSKLKVGDKAPDFTLPSPNGDVTLSALLGAGKRAVVVYFYPKDETPGCTAEACSFRDQYAVFKDAGAEVVGVSSDSVDSHRKFADNRKLPFVLCSDAKGDLRRAWGVQGNLFGMIPGRVTFVIDKEGVVRHVFSSQMGASKHVDEALAVIKALP